MDQGQQSQAKPHTKVRQDLTGKRFGKLIVLEKTDKKKSRATVWKCQCDCGNLCEKSVSELNSGFATSCGCKWRQPAIHEGDRFGKLTAIRPTEKRSARSVVWECQCDCGNIQEVRATMLTSGHTTSCGCVKKAIDEKRDFKEVLTYVNGTCIEFARDIGKKRSTTSPDTGVRGVILKNGKFQAHIYFLQEQRKRPQKCGYRHCRIRSKPCIQFCLEHTFL